MTCAHAGAEHPDVDYCDDCRQAEATFSGATLDELLEEFTVSNRGDHAPQDVAWWPESLPWGVSDPGRGIIALFATDRAALHYRLLVINQFLNDGWEWRQS